MIKKYKKKPVTIEAMQFTEETISDCMKWVGKDFYETRECIDDITILRFFIKTLEGDHEVKIGDYIIKGVKGEFYPCKSDIFGMTYDEVE